MECNSIKNVASNSIIYTASGILMKCFSFFLLPLYTAYLTTNDYGIVNIARNFLIPMSFIVSFSLFSAVSRFYVILQDNVENLRRFYGSVSILVFLSGIFWSAIFTVKRNWIIEYVFTGIDYYPIVFLCLLSLIFESQYNIYIQILKSQQRAKKASVVSIAYFLLTVFLNIFFVVILKNGASGVLLATLISNVVFFIYFIFDMLKDNQIEFVLDLKLLKDALSYSIPIMPHNLSTHIAMLVSSVLIGSKTSFSMLGIYAVAIQFGNIADTIQGYVDSAYGPWLYQQLKTKDKSYKEIIAKATDLLVSGIGLSFIGISLFAHDYIVLFLNKSYVDAWIYVPLLVTVFSIKTVYYFYVEVLFYYRQAARFLFIATLSGSIINILLSCIIIPKYGILGAIISNAVSMVIRVLIVIKISRYYDDIGLKLSVFFKNFIIVEFFIVMGSIFSYTVFYSEFSVLNFIYKIIIIVLYIILCMVRFQKELKSYIIRLKMG